MAMVGGLIAGFIGNTCRFFYDASASNLDAGASIAQQPFTDRAGMLASLNQSYSNCRTAHGEFLDDNTGYVGFRFDVGNGLQYGWARLRLHNLFTANFQLLDYAYADPGEAILAGQRREGDKSPVTEESLGGLALGAVGLNAWRKRRQRRLA